MDSLFNIDLETYTTFLYYWGALGILSSIAIYFSKQLPISNKVENEKMSILGRIDKKTGWMIMETPILIAVVVSFFLGSKALNLSAVMVAAFVIHYFNRAIIYPNRIKVKGKTMPLSTVLFSMIFYIINGFLIGYYFGSLREYDISWTQDPRFIIGLTLFILGFFINIQSDNILIKLRKPGETGYKIPRGGMYRFISCPNYFGETIEWIGFAIMSWSLPGLIYAIWVGLPLFAQSLEAHKWYKNTFKDDYPPERKAFIPFII